MCVGGDGGRAQPAPQPAFPPQVQASDVTGWGQPVGPGPFAAASCWGRIDSLGLDPNEGNVLDQPQVPLKEGREPGFGGAPGTQALL